MRKLGTVLTRLATAATSLALGIAIATTALVGFSPSPASADNGFCGVRVSDQGYPVTIVVAGHRQWCETLAPYGGRYTYGG